MTYLQLNKKDQSIIFFLDNTKIKENEPSK